ncbi:MAG: TRAP transporter large permease [Butyricicoccus pullicaecorum]|nr:TRAP transporter large permease [Butyricicoccus pullicaecorum]
MVFLPLILMFVLFALNIPVAFGMLISGLIYFTFMNNDIPTDMMVQNMVSGTESFSMLAIPFFITAGSVMGYAGISAKLMSFAEILVGHMKGGMGQVNCVLSALMGGISGSANADACFEAKMLVPEMEKRGFSREFSAAVTSASSCITPIIPPGICLILYANVANVSVQNMFFAGYIPGFAILIALMIVVHLVSSRDGYGAMRGKMSSLSEIGKGALESIWALMLPFGIVLGLRLGWFTPTECGAVLVVYSLLVGIFVYHEFKPKHIPLVLKESVISTACVMFIICTAKVLAKYLSWEQIPAMISTFLTSLTDNKFVFLLLVNLFLLLMGMFFDTTAALIIFPPLLLPAALALGINPIHFGIIICINITIGGISPPFGVVSFAVLSVCNAKMGRYIRQLTPFLVALLIVLALVTFVEPVSMFLPSLLGS